LKKAGALKRREKSGEKSPALDLRRPSLVAQEWDAQEDSHSWGETGRKTEKSRKGVQSNLLECRKGRKLRPPPPLEGGKIRGRKLPPFDLKKEGC